MEEGTPYTLSECKLVLQEHKDQMDEYHWHLMEWLVKEVERLQKESLLLFDK